MPDTAPVVVQDAETAQFPQSTSPVSGSAAQVTVWFCGCVNVPSVVMKRAPAPP